MSVPSWAVKGAKVACVRTFTDLGLGETGPRMGQVLTVREVRPTFLPQGGFDLMFEEIVNLPRPYREGVMEAGFHHSGFRPLVTIEDDIKAHFAQHLTAKRDASLKEPERA